MKRRFHEISLSLAPLFYFRFNPLPLTRALQFETSVLSRRKLSGTIRSQNTLRIVKQNMEDEDVEERTDEDVLLSEFNLKLQSLAVGSSVKNRWIALGYLQCYFVTIAAILGNGTLGLPAALSQSGFTLFVVVILLEALIQILIVFYFLELLQRGYLAKRQELLEATFTGDEDIALNDTEGDIEEEEGNDKSELDLEINRTDACEVVDTVLVPTLENLDAVHSQPSLHTLAELFLANGLRQICEVVILLMFVSLLVNYALGASQACSQLLDFNVVCILAVFVGSCAFCIVFVNSCVVTFVSVLTLLDGCLLLTATICTSLFIESQLNLQQIQSEFKNIGQPFVFGTVALGVVVNILPVLFEKVHPSVSQIRGFCRSVIAGILTCVVIIILWAARNRNISAIHVAKVIKSEFPEYGWIAVLIQVFVIASITVSFLTMGTGMKHMVDSWFDSFYSTTQTNWQEVKSKWEGVYCRANIRWFLKVTIILSLFGFLFAVAALNPTGTVTVLWNVASMTLNVELGVFVVIMLRRSRGHEFSHIRVPLPLSRYLYHLQYFVFAYFLIAVGFNIVEIIKLSPYNQSASSGVESMINQTPATFNSTWDNSSLSSLHNRRWRIHNILLNNGTL